MNENLENSIRKTLAYFDIFDHPLTKEELFCRLNSHNKKNNIGFVDFILKLKKIKNKKDECIFEYKNGYYFLPGREEIIDSRQRTIRLLERKMKIAKRGVRKLRYVPFIRGIFICNTVASASTTDNSDIDVFIVVKKNRIWLSRLLITLVLNFFDLRRTKKKIKDKICLSFYVADNNLNLSNICIEQPDIYLMYWLDQLIPVYDPDDFREKILKKNNWAKKYLPNAFRKYKLLSRWKVDDTDFTKKIKNNLDKILRNNFGIFLESQTKKLQKIKMNRNYSSIQNESDSRVVISDNMLKFHENDRREYYKNMWEREVGVYFESFG